MKTSRFFAMTLVIVLSLAFNTTQAQPNQQTANGNASVTLNQTGSANNPLNGESAFLNGGGQYAVTDPAFAQGNAGATGVAAGTSTGPIVSTNGVTTTASGNAQSTVSSLSSGTGAGINVSISGGAQQGTWSGTTADPNATTFANAGEATSGGYSGTGGGGGTISQNGTGTATGKNSVSTVNVGGLNITSTFETDGTSIGTITTSTPPAATQQLSASVSGGFVANGASLVGDPTTGTWGDASGTGAATYSGTSPAGTIQGAGLASGQTNAVINTNTTNQVSVSASSTVASTAQVK